MKTIALILPLIISLHINHDAFGQSYSEWSYFSLKAGLNHGFYSRIPAGEFEVLELKGIEQRLMPEQEKHYAYGLGYDGSLVYNWDFKNNRTGLQLGFNYHIVPQTLTLNAYPSHTQIKAKIKRHAVSPEMAFKFGGKDLYDKQKYLTVGINYRHFFLQKYQYFIEKEKIATHSENFETGKLSTFVAANWMFFYIQFTYMPDSKAAPPFWITTGLHIPMTSFTHRKSPLFNIFIRRIFAYF